ncbi:hypothetical protein GH808_05690 [Acetobacterium fimetarium]|uniref:HTH cro/C1-type domain-containing protein n=1 Tax=Acetobacterium fimetarium TaxID=52691 RepID=A0ABR6WTH9_9FIRM|nr:hypothetical protein [Acetobacterium fimetarium]MBC3803928.1 hypothetical protein [Acetobacterium fimetarium]
MMNKHFIHVEPDPANPGYYLCTMFDQTAIAELLSKMRGFRTQEEVGRAVYLTDGAIRHYEAAREMPSDLLKPRIARLYNMTVQELFYDQVITVTKSAQELMSEVQRWPSCFPYLH